MKLLRPNRSVSILGGVEDEGWTRYILDEQEFSYRVLHDAEIRAGNLAAS
jgi:hypothetical protein